METWTGFDARQLAELQRGEESGVNTSRYSDTRLIWLQMREIRLQEEKRQAQEDDAQFRERRRADALRHMAEFAQEMDQQLDSLRSGAQIMKTVTEFDGDPVSRREWLTRCDRELREGIKNFYALRRDFLRECLRSTHAWSGHKGTTTKRGIES